MCAQEIFRDELYRAGVFVKSTSVGAPIEQEYANEKMMIQTITLDVRSEWRREIPVKNIVDQINFCVEFGILDQTPPVITPNLQINTFIELSEQIENL